MANQVNPSDVGRLGHRFQVRVQNTVSSELGVISRLQRFEPSIRQETVVHYELGTVDPVGYTAPPPQFQIAMEQNVYNLSPLDLIMAGKNPASATTWNLADYNVGNGPLTFYLLERDNNGVVQGEIETNGGILTDVTWSWQVGQAISGRYTGLCRVGKHWSAASAPHASWGVQDTSSQGGIMPKDARLFLTGNGATQRVFRIQSMTLRCTWRTQVVNELGNRQVVGILAEPPDVSLDVDIAYADHQPDDIIYVTSGTNYYDYQNFNLMTGNAIRIYDPTAVEATSVLRAFSIENLVVQNATPANAQVRGLATKRYSFLRPKVTTANTGGVKFFIGDIV